MNSAATHRPEIGGLRAIAVVAVLVYHADFPFLTGGFVGVDVFFVLSGFLVASMLMRTDPSGQVNLNKFFDRRLRRIFPALVPCFIASWLVSFNVMNETQFADFNRSLAASAVFGANFFFWSSIGYFDGSAELKPLLHMWSLGIEIQFYLFYAVLVWALVKFKFTLLIPTLGLLIVSMVWAVVTVAGGNADAAFYLPHLRLWEMLAGSALAFIQFRRLNTYVSTSIELVGILLIMVPMISYAEGYPAFPGLSALPPVLGTVLIVAANNGGAVVAPALRNPILQAVGKISYSLYLWHLPIIVYIRFLWPAPSLTMTAVALLLSTFLAFISYRLVEEPFRHRILQTTTGLGAGFICTIVALGTLSLMAGSAEMRSFQADAQAAFRRAFFSEQTAAALSAVDAAEVDYQANLNVNFTGGSRSYSAARDASATCSYDLGNATSRVQECLASQSANDTVLVIGDSHGRDTLHALRLAYPSRNFTMLHQSGCPPADFQQSKKVRCFSALSEVLDQLSSTENIEGVVLSFRYRPGEWKEISGSLPELHRLKVPVMLVGPRPVYRRGLGDWLTRLPPFQSPPLEISKAQRDMLMPEYMAVEREARTFANNNGLTYIAVMDAFCGSGSCRLFDGSVTNPIIWDQSHLTRRGIEILAGHLTKVRPQLLSATRSKTGA